MKVIESNLSIKVTGTGKSLPKNSYTNEDLLKFLAPEESDHHRELLSKKIETMFGFKKRHLVTLPGQSSQHSQTTEDLGLAAAMQASQGVESGIEATFFGSTTATRYTGTTAAAISGQLGIKPLALDVKCGCSTSLATLNTGLNYLQTGHDRVLIICSETLSKVTGTLNRENVFGLADGSAALCLDANSAHPDYLVQHMLLQTDGTHVDLYTTPGTLPPVLIDTESYTLQGDSKRMRELAIQHYEDMFMELSSRNLLDGIDYLIPHQVNVPMIRGITEKFGLDLKILHNSNEIGNIGGASVLYTLVDNHEKATFKKGDRILLMSVGGGLSYGFQIWQKN